MEFIIWQHISLQNKQMLTQTIFYSPDRMMCIQKHNLDQQHFKNHTQKSKIK